MQPATRCQIMTKLLLIILDGVPYRNWRRLFGNLEGWVANGDATVHRIRAVLPSTSASCYASIHTGVPPQVHRVWGNEAVYRLEQPDVFSETTKAGLKTGAVTHSFWSEFFNRAPFDVVRDIEYDEPGGPITHGRFHTMTGYGNINQMTPSDVDLFATLTRLCEVHGIDYSLEYGTDRLEILADGFETGPRVLIVDDLLATGGTASACSQLVQQVGGDLCGFAFVAELADLGGRAKLPDDVPVESLIIYT